MIRLALSLCAVALGVAVIWFLDSALPPVLAIVLLDKEGATYPYSIQNLMWLIFFVGAAEVFHRLIEARAENRQLHMGYLPEDDRTLIVKAMLPGIYKKTSLLSGSDTLFLPGLVRRIISAFQTTSSIENASAVLTSSIDLRSHDLDLKYSMLRYIMWVIPTFGFIGTVVGIALALNYAGQPESVQDPQLLPELTRRLAVAFNTTLVALVMSAILVLAMHIVQGFEERVLNRCGVYCLDNLVNRLYKTDDAGE